MNPSLKKKVKRFGEKATKAFSSVIESTSTPHMPNFIKNPTRSNVVSNSTKAVMIQNSSNQSMSSVAFALLQQIGIDEPIKLVAKRWLAWDKDPETRQRIESLHDDEQELERLLRPRIQFGTAGLRGRMDAGFANMNSLIVVQTSQGLTEYVLNQQPNAREAGVVVGYDTRRNSSHFAKLVVAALLAKGIKVYWFEDYVPTPYVSFSVRRRNAAAGVMITASHNPADDNGYKVYWSNGAQINAPHDVAITKSIMTNLEPWNGAWITDAIFMEDERVNGSVETILTSTMLDYTKAVTEFALRTGPFANLGLMSNHMDKVVYTPLHGVGAKYFLRLATVMGLHPFVTIVPSQENPHPGFPTLRYPNPEARGALSEAIRIAEKKDISLVIANDPDADRFAVAQRVREPLNIVRWHIFTGDQIGILLADHMRDTIGDEKTYMLTTAVSSDMLRNFNGFLKEETLTGFKWLGNRAHALQSDGKTAVPFAYEEALGYMFPEVSFDKDGLAAAMVFLVAMAKWRMAGLSPWTKLQSLYSLYGHFETLNITFPTDEVKTFATFRHLRQKASRWRDDPANTVGMYYPYRFRDLTVGEEWERLSQEAPKLESPSLPTTKDVQMVTVWLRVSQKPNFTVDKEVRFTLRGSGTEPKIKLYMQARTEDQVQGQRLIQDVFEVIINELLREPGNLATYLEEFTSEIEKIFSSSGRQIRWPLKWSDQVS